MTGEEKKEAREEVSIEEMGKRLMKKYDAELTIKSIVHEKKIKITELIHVPSPIVYDLLACMYSGLNSMFSEHLLERMLYLGKADVPGFETLTGSHVIPISERPCYAVYSSNYYVSFYLIDFRGDEVKVILVKEFKKGAKMFLLYYYPLDP